MTEDREGGGREDRGEFTEGLEEDIEHNKALLTLATAAPQDQQDEEARRARLAGKGIM